ncbi:D-sedoheptulose 7-phosphate isomerase [Lachnotalea glycerini]|uniref:D-sedoheptulose 7-phosphate isomerase n=1 Tax=Lachnotalea glycerini TaxID=1763509 RepID=A0A318EMW3_9FIRM|nr:SIS domain-containing protein [Lachnotalea glycerini]PXV91453.1 D-sedoheptulose 7-phosphate isomerase [Lachnotalea glycerini]
MKDTIQNYLNELIQRYKVLEPEKENISKAYEMITESFRRGGKLLIAGNGGSAADAEHIVGELMKGFVKPRKLKQDFCKSLMSADEQMGKELANNLQGALPAIALVDHVALSTAYLNDVEPLMGFAQQVNGFGVTDDVFLAISTSGSSKNILYAAVVAKAKGMKIVALSGKDGGKLKDYADVSIIVDENETFKIQELHLPVYHCLCLMLEETFF